MNTAAAVVVVELGTVNGELVEPFRRRSWAWLDQHGHAVETDPRRGKYWAGLRSAFMPLFQTDSLAAYAPDVNAAAAKLASRCMEGGPAGSSRVARSTATRANTDKPEPSVTSRRTLAKRAADVGNVADLASAPFNISEALADYAMEVVGSTAFG